MSLATLGFIVYIYARLSKNRHGVSDSVPGQIAECEEYAKHQEWPVAGIFSDDDISVSSFAGGRPRPGYDAMLEAIRAGEAARTGKGVVILVTEMSRLYRRLEDLLDVIYLARETPLRRLWTTNDRGFELTTDEGIRNAVNAVYDAVEESKRLSERVKRTKRRSAREGKNSGGRRAFGFEGPRFDGHGNIVNKHLIGVAHVPEEAEVIRDVAKKLINGRTLHSVVTELNVKGIKSAGGNDWYPYSLKRMLQSPRLKGIRMHQGVEYTAIWEPILDEETWEELQTVFNAEWRFAGASRKGVRSYLLTGLAFCGICENHLNGYGFRRRRDAPVHRRYVCRRLNDKGHEQGCGKISRNADAVEALVTEGVLYRLDSADMDAMLADATASESAVEVQALLEKRIEQKARLVEMAEAYAKGILTLQQVSVAKGIVDETLDSIERQLQRLSSGRALASLPAGATFAEEWERRDIHWRRNLLALVVERVIIHPQEGYTWTRWKDWRFDPSKIEIVWKV